MIEINRHTISIMVCYAISLHLVWVGAIISDPAALNATALHALRVHNISPGALAATIFAAAICAAIGICTKRPWVVLLLLPQQLLLMMSAAGCFDAMWIAQFADGVVRPRAFLVADQSPAIIAAIGHTIAITAHALRVVR